MCWSKEAEEAMKRRAKLNTPWPSKPKCLGCGVEKKLSMYNPLYCDDCIRAAFDVVS